MAKTIYSFALPSDVRAVSRLDRDAARSLLGGKGAGLFEMSRIGLPVPPGFTVTTDACRAGGALGANGLSREFLSAVSRLERATGRALGGPSNPLLVSVRSGSKFSMPGMMDTILNLGLNDETVLGLAAQTGDARFAWDCYRRFIAMFGAVVKGVPKDDFEAALRRAKAKAGAAGDAELDTASLRALVAAFKEIYRGRAGSPFPQEPAAQLRSAVAAVFASWNNPRAAAYRRLHKIPDDLGTACTVQAMVFGNMGPDSATGVGFTRDPGTGERAFYGEFLVNAQGEDVVAGTRTPRPLAELALEMPRTYARLLAISSKLERHYGDVQDMEFTIEKGRLYMLQTRTGRRSAPAALRIAVDMVAEGLIEPARAVMRLSPEQLDELLRPVFEEGAAGRAKALARGLPAGPGAATGLACFSADRAVEAAKLGPVILIRSETSPDDIHGMAAAEGILTATGGMTSHAAVVGRGMGKVCVVGCSGLEVDEASGTARFAGGTLREGDWISLDGFKGAVLEGRVETRPSEILESLRGLRKGPETALVRRYRTFMSWVDAERALEVRANADTPEDARVALALGAAGIGLCRTEHMFFGEDRVPKVLAMILAGSERERAEAVRALHAPQKADFKRIFETMRGLPVTIRTIDPPLHEFLPRTAGDAARAAQLHGLDAGKLWAKTQELKESNPMLGHRGCRLGVTYPEITEMQADAILSAACEVALEGGSALPEIMIPLVGHAAELRHQKERIARVADRVFRERGVAVRYQIGTMIEVPRAALTAGEIAEEAEFFSFGTNDLTQMTLGYSRDDYGRYIGRYLDLKILAADPFRTLDRPGVGCLVRLAADEGRKARPGLKLGVCGEHGGDPASIRFFHEAGLHYVSCSPYRVPVARLAAARAAIACAARAAAAALLLALPSLSRANPTDGSVVAGSASIGTSGSVLTVTQASENAIIEWGGFSIGQGETARFLQPSALSSVLNRVTGGDPSAIYGALEANGRVFLLNPNGVTVGPTGVINAQSFVASTLDVDDASFLAGEDPRFAGGSAASLVNAGRISALGGDILLIARTVRNEGELAAPGGTVGLAAGSEVLFQPGGDERVFVRAGAAEGADVGVDQRGSVLAAAAELKAAGGNAYSLAINHEGVIRATGVERRGGRVYLVSDGAAALREGSVIDASGSGAGDGGDVLVWGGEAASFRGLISVRGGEEGGNGGNVEVSGGRLDFGGFVDASAPRGLMGSLLIDPYDLTISNAPNGAVDAANPDESVGAGANLSVATLAGQLSAANVTVRTGGAGLEAGHITVADALSWGGPTAGSLTIDASGDVVVNAPITSGGGGSVVLRANGGLGSIFLNSNVTTSGAAQTYDGAVFLGADVALNTGGGALHFRQTVDGAAGASRGLAIDSGAGDVTFSGFVGLGSALSFLDITGAAGARILIDGGAVTTAGAQRYGQAVLLGGVGTDVELTGGGGVRFDGTVDGGKNLVIDNGSGDTTFSGAVGAASALRGLYIDGSGAVHLDGGGVTTMGKQRYGEAVVLGGPGAGAALTSASEGVDFQSTVDGARSLTVASGAGDVLFAGAVGGAAALASVSASGARVFVEGGLVATGDVVWNAPLLGSGLSLFGGRILMGGDVTSSGPGGVLMVATDSFQNTGSHAISPAGGGRFLIYSVEPGRDVLGGLTGSAQYATTFAGGPAPGFAGNGFLYSAGSAYAPLPRPGFDLAVFSNDRPRFDDLSFDGCRVIDRRKLECERSAAYAVGGGDSASPGDLFSWDLGTLRDAVADPVVPARSAKP